MPYRNVYRSKIHEDMVQLLARTTVDKAETSLFTSIRQLMIFAALLGYSQNRKIPLDKTKGVEDIQIHIFENDLVTNRFLYFFIKDTALLSFLGLRYS